MFVWKYRLRYMAECRASDRTCKVILIIRSYWCPSGTKPLQSFRRAAGTGKLGPGNAAAPAQCARKEGDFLLVGLHSDEDVQGRRGPHLPLMDLHERSLSVLACKYVDEVIIGAFNAAAVCFLQVPFLRQSAHGSRLDYRSEVL